VIECPITVTTGARGFNSASWCSGTSASRDSGSSSLAAFATVAHVGHDDHRGFLIQHLVDRHHVAQFHQHLDDFSRLTDILWARSPTVMSPAP